MMPDNAMGSFEALLRLWSWVRVPAVPPIKTMGCVITHPLKPSVRKSVRKHLRILVLNPSGYDIAVRVTRIYSRKRRDGRGGPAVAGCGRSDL